MVFRYIETTRINLSGDAEDEKRERVLKVFSDIVPFVHNVTRPMILEDQKMPTIDRFFEELMEGSSKIKSKYFDEDQERLKGNFLGLFCTVS